MDDNSDVELEAKQPETRAEQLARARAKALEIRQAKAREKNQVKSIRQENEKLEKENEHYLG